MIQNLAGASLFRICCLQIGERGCKRDQRQTGRWERQQLRVPHYKY